MTSISFHGARSCACGAGLDMIDTDYRDERFVHAIVRVIASRPPLLAAEIAHARDVDAMEFPGVHVVPVTCVRCGSIESATHVLLVANGNPDSVYTLAAMSAFTRQEIARQERLRTELPPLLSLKIPEGL